MATAVQPLLVLSDERIEDEVRRATFIGAGAAHDRRKTARLVALCVSDYLIGLVAIGLSLRIVGSDQAQMLFFFGVLRALGWPAWRVILSVWLEHNG